MVLNFWWVSKKGERKGCLGVLGYNDDAKVYGWNGLQGYL
jgi:hypothetical protein